MSSGAGAKQHVGEPALRAGVLEGPRSVCGSVPSSGDGRRLEPEQSLASPHSSVQPVERNRQDLIRAWMGA
jgi:hypothetical protein